MFSYCYIIFLFYLCTRKQASSKNRGIEMAVRRGNVLAKVDRLQNYGFLPDFCESKQYF